MLGLLSPIGNNLGPVDGWRPGTHNLLFPADSNKTFVIWTDFSCRLVGPYREADSPTPCIDKLVEKLVSPSSSDCLMGEHASWEMCFDEEERSPHIRECAGKRTSFSANTSQEHGLSYGSPRLRKLSSRGDL